MSLFDKLVKLNEPKVEVNVEKEPFLDRLEALGGEHAVNPPPPAGETCSGCGQVFKVLARHRCKASETPAEVGETQESIQTPSSPPGRLQAPSAASYTLMLDALFERGALSTLGVIHFSDLIGPLAADVAQENQQDHWGAVEFGRGGPLLAAKLEKWIVSEKPQGVILADSSTPELRAVKEVLKRLARCVIQGVR